MSPGSARTGAFFLSANTSGRHGVIGRRRRDATEDHIRRPFGDRDGGAFVLPLISPAYGDSLSEAAEAL